MARNDGVDRTFVRNQDLPTLNDVAKAQEHNEREKENYQTENIYVPFTQRGAVRKEDAIAKSKKPKARPRKGR